MKATKKELDALKNLQQVDREILQLQRELDTLPQREKLISLREKRDTLQAKQEQVASMKMRAETRLAKTESEDATLAERQRQSQELIDEAGADFRSIEAYSKEMGGFVQRRDELSQLHDKLSAELEKIATIQKQLERALDIIAVEEEGLTDEYLRKKGSLQKQIDNYTKQRSDIADTLDENLLTLYEKIAGRSGGVAIGTLNETRCGVCRSTIDGGRLIELRASYPLGICPSCGRLLIIPKENSAPSA